MAENERKEIVLSYQFDLDIIEVFIYGEEVFGTIAAKSFVIDIFNRVLSLDLKYYLHPECRHLHTKNKIYRNIILGSPESLKENWHLSHMLAICKPYVGHI
jgi:toxin ParE1/3/4